MSYWADLTDSAWVASWFSVCASCACKALISAFTLSSSCLAISASCSSCCRWVTCTKERKEGQLLNDRFSGYVKRLCYVNSNIKPSKKTESETKKNFQSSKWTLYLFINLLCQLLLPLYFWCHISQTRLVLPCASL